MITRKGGWSPIYGSLRTLENWIIPRNGEENKRFEARGVITDINPDYSDCTLKGTGVNIRNERNNYLYFFGQIPESFLGKAVAVEQLIIGEEKDSYTVEQRIVPLEPLEQYEEKTFFSPTFPKRADCNMILYAIGKFPKKVVSFTIKERLQNFLCRGRVGS